MSRFNPRRSFRDERSRTLYLTASEAGWSHRLDGKGHLAMASPDGKTRMTLSLTGRAARAALNNEAVFKRWVRMQNAIDKVGGTTSGFPGIAFNQPVIEETPMGDAADLIKDEDPQDDRPHATGDEVTVTDERTVPIEELRERVQRFCADGCGKPVKGTSLYARGHNPNSKGWKTREAKANGTDRPVASLFKAPDDRFSIGEVVDIANYAGNGSGLVEIRQLEKGLRLIQRMRGNA